MHLRGISRWSAFRAVVPRPWQVRLGVPRFDGAASVCRGTTAVSLLVALAACAALSVSGSPTGAQDVAPAVKAGANPSAARPSATNAPGDRPLPSRRGKSSRSLAPLAITPEREAAVMTFVERNHAELAELLSHLKANQPQEYEQAIRELFRVTERLATIQERDTTQYELEIDLWTAQSRVQLLAAKLKMGVTDELRDQLRQALAVQGEARLALLQHERERVKNRLGRLERDIEQFEANRERTIERQLNVLTRAAGGTVGKKSAKNKK